jgi:hypothetical protein
MLFTLTYILTFFAGDEPLSVTKDETFATLQEAQDRADALDIKYHEHYDYAINTFAINGERFIPITDRMYEEYYDVCEAAREEENWEDWMRDCEADTAINLAKDKQALQDDDYLPF